MIAFIKNHSHKNINKKLLLLYVLNVTDLLFTLLLLSTGYFMEANRLMTSAVENKAAGFMLKVILPAIILLYVYYRIQHATEKQLKRANLMISGITVIYAFINASHLVWLTILPLLVLN